MTISIPNITSAIGQICAAGKLGLNARIISQKPQSNIITPIAMPTNAPPWGSPKHSCSIRRRSYLRETWVPVSKLAPQLTQTKAVSSFLVPHFEQYTIRIVSSHSINFHFVHKVFGEPKKQRDFWASLQQKQFHSVMHNNDVWCKAKY